MTKIDKDVYLLDRLNVIATTDDNLYGSSGTIAVVARPGASPHVSLLRIQLFKSGFHFPITISKPN
jgi:hypothetical protein